MCEKQVQACLSAREDRETSLHRCRGPVRLVQAFLCEEITWKSRFNKWGGAVKQVQACLSASEDRESSLHHCGGPLRLVQACICVGRTLYLRFTLRGGAVRHV